MHDSGEIENRLEVVEIAHLGGLAHQQMMADKPGDGIGFGQGEAQARSKLASDPLAGNGVMFRSALGDVVQQHGDIKRPPARRWNE